MKAQILLPIAIVTLLCASVGFAQTPKPPGNKPERVEWFRDLGFGMFIHWNIDGTLGGVISHSLVGASPDYMHRYFTELPQFFNPHKYNPADWAALAKLAGMQYVVFTTKHHSGFCMFETKTTEFNSLKTPYGKDITKQLVQAFRQQGIAVGFYYSPDDFLWLAQHKKPVARAPHPGVTPQENPGLMEYDKAQIKELLTNYGAIDFMFLDGPPAGLREYCWELQPNVVVTRGAIVTPEQYIPGLPLEGAWEANLTMGTEWPYKPTNETYKSGQDLIRTLIETRAKGGNLLLNVGPKPDGELPIQQEDRLREVAFWMFINREAIYHTRPWSVTNEGAVWFTKKAETVYAIVTDPWQYGEPKMINLKTLETTKETKVSVLGHDSEILEYKPDVKPTIEWQQTPEGLKIKAWKAHRLYTNNQWPNPVVLKITNVKSAFVPPQIVSLMGTLQADKTAATLQGRLDNLGKASSVEVGFQYRVKPEADEFNERKWTETKLISRAETGIYNATITGLDPKKEYEFRALVKHPLITLTGKDVAVR